MTLALDSHLADVEAALLPSWSAPSAQPNGVRSRTAHSSRKDTESEMVWSTCELSHVPVGSRLGWNVQLAVLLVCCVLGWAAWPRRRAEVEVLVCSRAAEVGWPTGIGFEGPTSSKSRVEHVRRCTVLVHSGCDVADSSHAGHYQLEPKPSRLRRPTRTKPHRPSCDRHRDQLG